MIPSVKKVIRAGAGTGKTYRLSLEYIGLLLQFHRRGLHFSEILVITFTKKATAEIRERIFSHLHDIIEQNESGRELRQNLEAFFDLHISDNELRLLKDIYVDMRTNKQQVQISTIDSFTNTIFKTIIAPYLGITDFEIKTKIDDHVLDELYRSILEDKDKLATFRSFFERTELKKINDYEAFIQSVIRNRWIFHLIKLSPERRSFEDMYEQPELFLGELKQAFVDFGNEFQNYLNREHADKSAKGVLLGAWFSLLNGVQPNVQLQDIRSALNTVAGDKELLAKHAALLLDESKNVWNGGRLLRKKAEAPIKERLQEFWAQVRRLLADYLFAAFLLPEEKELFDISEFVIDRYDELKFRDKVFTHDDVSYYTFKYLYDPELSLIDNDYVANSFYEHLSSLTRFVLIDEFQDTSIIQYKILIPIIREVISGAGIKEYGGAIVVGDEKQSIYGWRGGERDLLLKMPSVMPDSRDITLDTSYRSDENIVAFVNALFSQSSLQQQLREENIVWPYFEIKANKMNQKGRVELYIRNYSRGKQSSNKISTEEEAIREFLRGTLQQLLHKQHISINNTAILARRNKELDAIAAALDEMGIRYMQESSRSIMDHPAIKPIFQLLKFLVYRDFYDLLAFLRSDVVLLAADELKELLLAYRDADEKWNVDNILAGRQDSAAVNKVALFLRSIEGEHDIFLLVQHIIEEYNVTALFSSESDAKNIDRFLMLIAAFTRSHSEYSATLKGFYDYCRDENESDAFKQVGLEEEDAISLLTIHKAKGLEFDNVFVYWNLSGGSRGGRRELSAFLDYAPDYSRVQNYLLAFNYDAVVARSSQSLFAEQVQRREAIEELNNFYVALTRAKSNLFLAFTFKKSGGIDTLLAKARGDKSMTLLFVEQVRALFEQKYEFHRYDKDKEMGAMGDVTTVAAKVTKQQKKSANLAEFLNADRTAHLQSDEERLRLQEHVNFKSVFLKSRAVDVGTIVHFYLSFVKRGTDAEKALAKHQTTSFYGGLMPDGPLHSLFEYVDKFIEENKELFAARWTKVFTEYTLFTPEGREIRIDRFMVDEKTKEIQIIDYKTGHILEEEQMETYINTIKSLPVTAGGGYTVTGDFRGINLPANLMEEK